MSFEDCEKSGFEFYMFRSIYFWLVTYNNPRFSKFLDLCSSPSP
jgi:hypothetical protein